MKSFSGAVLFGAALITPAVAQATIVSFNYSGIIDPAYTNAGRPFSGSFSYDAADPGSTADNNGDGIVDQATYLLAGPLTLTGPSGSYTASGELTVYFNGLNSGVTQYDVEGATAPIGANFEQAFIGLSIVTPLTPYSGTLPTSFANAMSVTTSFSRDDNLNGTVLESFVGSTAVRATSAVPEPASWALMVLGIGAAGAMRRRKRTGFRAA